MLRILKALRDDEFGVIISAELVLVLTIAVLAMVSGLNEVATAINTELNDLSNAFGHLTSDWLQRLWQQQLQGQEFCRWFHLDRCSR